jgi:hypothetical protein
MLFIPYWPLLVSTAWLSCGRFVAAQRRCGDRVLAAARSCGYDLRGTHPIAAREIAGKRNRPLVAVGGRVAIQHRPTR